MEGSSFRLKPSRMQVLVPVYDFIPEFHGVSIFSQLLSYLFVSDSARRWHGSTEYHERVLPAPGTLIHRLPCARPQDMHYQHLNIWFLTSGFSSSQSPTASSHNWSRLTLIRETQTVTTHHWHLATLEVRIVIRQLKMDVGSLRTRVYVHTCPKCRDFFFHFWLFPIV